jgi:ABC-type uncharacterized transport system substrate-binding protein
MTSAYKKIAFLFLIFLLTFADCSNQKKIRSIGVAQLASDPVTDLCLDGFLKALSEKGYRDKYNIIIDKQNAQGDYSKISRITKKFIDENVDVGIALSTVCLQSMITEKVKFPVVFAAIANPFIVGAGKSDADHLENVTGVPSTSPIKETFATIRELFPGVKKIGTLYVPSEPNSVYYADVQREEAKKFGFELVQKPVNSISEIEKAANSLVNEKVSVIYQISDILTATGFDLISRVANENKIPLICNQIVQVNAGASLGLCWDFYKIGYEAGLQVDRILRGEQPSKIPFLRMDRIILAVNRSAAKTQNVPLTEEFLKKANKVFH